MRLIVQPTLEAVIEVNKIVCSEGGSPHQCLSSDKIESAISSAFYPGSYPFSHGGLAKVAGALCFYLVKAHAFLDGNKRTGSLVTITFLNMHGMELEKISGWDIETKDRKVYVVPPKNPLMPDSVLNNEEDFTNHSEMYISSPDKLKKINPKMYEFFLKRFPK